MGLVAAAAVLVTNLTLGGHTAGADDAVELADALRNHSGLAGWAALARIVSAVALVAAAACFCHRPRPAAPPDGAVPAAGDPGREGVVAEADAGGSGGPPPGEPAAASFWLPATAVALLAGWAAMVVATSTIRGVVVPRQAVPLSTFALDDETTLALGLARSANRLGLALLAGGAALLAVTARRHAPLPAWRTHGWSVTTVPRPATEADRRALHARRILYAAITVAVAALPFVVASVPGLSDPESLTDPHLTPHGTGPHWIVTVTWVLLLVMLALDGWRRRKAGG